MGCGWSSKNGSEKKGYVFRVLKEGGKWEGNQSMEFSI